MTVNNCCQLFVYLLLSGQPMGTIQISVFKVSNYFFGLISDELNEYCYTVLPNIGTLAEGTANCSQLGAQILTFATDIEVSGFLYLLRKGKLSFNMFNTFSKNAKIWIGVLRTSQTYYINCTFLFSN